jgi:hypothetical protein
MGYRSDVAYTIRFKKEEDYHLFILEAKAKPETAGALDECTCICNEFHHRIDYREESIKWYDTFPEVAMHESLIDQADEWVKETDGALGSGTFGQYRLGYVFVRVGEDDNDTERREGGYNAYEWLSITRQIVEG